MIDQESFPEAFRDLFFQYYDTFFSFARSLVDDTLSARNLTTEAIVTLWLKRNDITGDINNRAFLYNVIRTNALSYLKYLQRTPGAGAYIPERHMDPSLPSTILQEIRDHVAREI
jgi:DNA-directed RNA polymerase specialized sigma24 family protein